MISTPSLVIIVKHAARLPLDVSFLVADIAIGSDDETSRARLLPCMKRLADAEEVESSLMIGSWKVRITGPALSAMASTESKNWIETRPYF